MARPHIEFIQSQALPWSRDALGDALPGVAVKTLSLDHDSGARSVVLRFPPAWTWDVRGAIGADEEFLVLDGEIAIDEVVYRRLDFAHLPAGTARARMASRGGAVVLSFFASTPGRAPASARPDDPRLVRHVAALDGAWGGDFHPQFPAGAGRKFLKRDPVSGEQTWLLGTMPLRFGTKPEKHPVVEEMYLLAGEVAGDRGIMRPGAYFWRPPEKWHGPYGTLTGVLYLFRTIGGPLSTVYGDPAGAFSWTPEHRPIVPPELAAFASPASAVSAY
jgi:hypothetical protein